jgi:hypothetical protein
MLYNTRKNDIISMVIGVIEDFNNMIKVYYTMLVCVEQPPFASDRPNTQILYNADDDRYDQPVSYFNTEAYSLSEKYNSIYMKIRDNTTEIEKRRMRDKLYDIVKCTCKQSLRMVNDKMCRVFMMDEKFKEEVFPRLRINKV